MCFPYAHDEVHIFSLLVTLNMIELPSLMELNIYIYIYLFNHFLRVGLHFIINGGFNPLKHMLVIGE